MKHPFNRIGAGIVCAIISTTAVFADGIHILRPIDGAIVRETVPIKVSPSDLPDTGYVSISIDGQFVTARVLPGESKPVYLWNTKSPLLSATDPKQKTVLADGDHTVTVSVYGDGNKLIGSQTIHVKLANSIALPATQGGILLSYHWHLNDRYEYTRQTELAIGRNGQTEPTSRSSVKYQRSVEYVEGNSALIRDKVLPVGYVQEGGQLRPVAASFLLRSKYRTVTTHGELVSQMKPLTPGDHFAFSVPTLPTRRVGIGDSWEAPIEMSFQWSTKNPGKVTGEARLEGLEWQDGYPCARIRETYSGSVTFPGAPATAGYGGGYPGASSSGYPGTYTGGAPPGYPGAYGGAGGANASASSNFGGPQLPAMGSSKPVKTDITVENVKYERVVYFAYNSGRLIKTDTTINIDAPISSADMSILGLMSSGGGSGYGGGPSYGNAGYPGQSMGTSGSMPGTGPGGPPAGPGGPPPGYAGPEAGSETSGSESSTANYPGAGYPGAAYPGGGYPGGGYPGSGGGNEAPAASPNVNVLFTENTDVAP